MFPSTEYNLYEYGTLTYCPAFDSQNALFLVSVLARKLNPTALLESSTKVVSICTGVTGVRRCETEGN